MSGRRTPHQHDELEQAEEVADGMERAPDVAQRHEARAGGARRFAQRAVPVCGDDHVEAPRETRQQCAT